VSIFSSNGGKGRGGKRDKGATCGKVAGMLLPDAEGVGVDTPALCEEKKINKPKVESFSKICTYMCKKITHINL